jgi:translin
MSPDRRPDRAAELAVLGKELHHHLGSASRAREVALPACRQAVQACSRSIRAVHRQEPEVAGRLADDAARHLRTAQEAMSPYPALAASGPLHDAEKEYAEARLTAAMVDELSLPSYAELVVSASAWLGGLAEAASELRRHLLDRLRDGELARSEHLLDAMDDAYGLLITIDYPDAVTGGLRRATDALRAVLERTRGDLTTTVLQSRLQKALESQVPPPDASGRH